MRNKPENPQQTTAAQTDAFLEMPDNIKSKLDKYLSILNENGGALVPYLFKEVEKIKQKDPENSNFDFWVLLNNIIKQDPDALAALKRARENLQNTLTLVKEENIKALAPYIDKVLQENPKAYKDITINDVINNTDAYFVPLDPADEITAKIIKKARQKKSAEEARAKQKETIKVIEPQGKVTYNQANDFKTTSTKLANAFFNYAPPVNVIDGQLALNTLYSDKNGKQISVLSSYSFNEKILNEYGITSREFTDFDYFVAMVCTNLFENGNQKISLTKLWHELGNPRTPNTRQLQELQKTLIKGLTTTIRISNREILEAYNKDTKSYTDIISPVMPVVINEEHNRVNGNITSGTIYILAKSPFMLVAEPLDQITQWNKDILKLYKGSRTQKYWRVLRYLMREIGWMKNDSKRHPVITFKKLFEDTQAKRTEDRNTILKLTEDLLKDVFVVCGSIKEFKIDHQRGRIELILNSASFLPPKNKNQK